MTDPDRYRILETGAPAEVRAKGSRFLAQAWRVADESEAQARLAEQARVHHGASHHCWAFRIGIPGAVRERYDDDGEPSSTAGLPILGALQRADVLDALVVVTRYFGGTKLGTGGLVRAYGEAAAKALERATFVPAWLLTALALECGYEDLGALEAVLGRHGEEIVRIERGYDPRPRMVLEVRRSRAEPLRAEIVEATGGRVAPRVTGSRPSGRADDKPV